MKLFSISASLSVSLTSMTFIFLAALLTGFGVFSVSKREARNGRNPRTGEVVKIAASKSVKFKTGSKLKDAVNK